MNSFRAALILGALASAQTPTVITSLMPDGELTTFTVQPTTGLTASSTLTTSAPSSSSSTLATIDTSSLSSTSATTDASSLSSTLATTDQSSSTALSTTFTTTTASSSSTTAFDPSATISPPLTFGPSVTSYTQTSYPSTTGSPVGNGYGSPSLTALPCAETSLQNPTITPLPHPSVYNPPSQQYGDPSLEGTYSPQDLSLPQGSNSLQSFEISPSPEDLYLPQDSSFPQADPYILPTDDSPILSGCNNVALSAGSMLLSGLFALLL